MPGEYERNGFRIDGLAAGYDRSGPTLGQDNEWVLGELLGPVDRRARRLAADGVFSSGAAPATSPRSSE